MKITYKQKPEDPPYPVMEGSSPIAKEFNSRQKKFWQDGVTKEVDSEFISVVLLEILAEDYNRRHASRKKTGSLHKAKTL